MDEKTKLAGLRVLQEERASRALRTGHMRKQFGDRLTKAMTAEVEQEELEVTALDAIIEMVSTVETDD